MIRSRSCAFQAATQSFARVHASSFVISSLYYRTLHPPGGRRRLSYGGNRQWAEGTIILQDRQGRIDLKAQLGVGLAQRGFHLHTVTAACEQESEITVAFRQREQVLADL